MKEYTTIQAKKAPAKKAVKKAYSIEGYNRTSKKIDTIINVLTLSGEIIETVNGCTGEIEYKLDNEYSTLYMLGDDFIDMIEENINDIYQALEKSGLEGVILAVNSIQANSKYLKVVAHKKTVDTYDSIESYRYLETDTNITINTANQATIQSIIDNLLIQ